MIKLVYPYKDLEYPRTIKCVNCEEIFSEEEIYIVGINPDIKDKKILIENDEEHCPYCDVSGCLIDYDCKQWRA